MACTYRQLGKGKLYFDPFDDAGALTGERAFGDCPEFTLAIDSESVEHFSSEEAVKTKDCEVLLEVTRSAGITCDHISTENVALFMLGDQATLSQSAGAATEEAPTVQQGRFYQLGAITGFLAGARDIESVVIQDVTDTTTYVEGTDYIEDLALGRIYIMTTAEGGSIADDDVLHINYDTTLKTWEEVTPITGASQSGAIRFIANNASGENRDYYFPNCLLKPSGDFSLIGDDWGQLAFEIEVLDPTVGSAFYIDGRAA